AQNPVHRLNATAVHLYRGAFPRLARCPESYCCNAARAAALAGTGQGNDVNRVASANRAELRYCALAWLDDSLGAQAHHFASGQPGSAEQVRQTLLHWQQDPDLAAVRAPDSLRKLPEAEQVAWRNLWAQVDALLARTTPGR